MKVHLYRKEEDLPADFGPVIEESKRLAVEKKMTVPRFVLDEPDYDDILYSFERLYSRLVSYPFSAVHVLMCGKDIQSPAPYFLQNISGTTVSKEIIALYLEKPPSQQRIKDVIFSTLPHELYHVMRKQSKDSASPRSLGSTIIEEGLAEVFRFQEMACEDPLSAHIDATKQLSNLNNQCIDDARKFWPELDATVSDYKNLVFGDFPFYNFSFCLVAATLEKKGWSVMDPEILKAPHSKILDEWRPELSGKLDLKDLQKMKSSINHSVLSPQP